MYAIGKYASGFTLDAVENIPMACITKAHMDLATQRYLDRKNAAAAHEWNAVQCGPVQYMGEKYRAKNTDLVALAHNPRTTVLQESEDKLREEKDAVGRSDDGRREEKRQSRMHIKGMFHSSFIR